MRNVNRRVIGIILALALALLAVFGFRRLSTGSRNQGSGLETALVERGKLIAIVSATGSVNPKRQVALMFKTPGRVAEVYVEVGDAVKQGDPLVRLDTAELELQVAQARAALAAAEAQLARLKAPPRPEDLAAAQAALDSARAQLEQLKAGPDEVELAAARAALDSAQKNLAKVLAGPTQFELDRAKRNLDQARNQLYAAQQQRDIVCGRANMSPEEALAQGITPATRDQCQQAEAQVLIAQVNVDQAAAALEELKAGPDEATVAAAQAQVAEAQARLQRLLKGPSEAELAAAEAQVRQAEAQLEKLKAGPTKEELAAAQAQVDQARATLQQAELALEQATLVAPMDGTVAAVNVNPGELVSSALPAVVLVDTSGFEITLAIDETDIGQVQVGQRVSIGLDAFPDRELSGRVTRIAPSGTAQQGIVSYTVTILPDPTDVPLRPGMTASVDIIVAEKENVLLVPNRALRFEEGRRIVLVQRGDETVPVEVQTGLRNDQFTEVVGGDLKEGDRVVTSVVPTNKPLEGGFFGR